METATDAAQHKINSIFEGVEPSQLTAFCCLVYFLRFPVFSNKFGIPTPSKTELIRPRYGQYNETSTTIGTDTI